MSLPPLTPTIPPASSDGDAPFLLLDSLYDPSVAPPAVVSSSSGVLGLAPRQPAKVHHQRRGRPSKVNPILATEEEIERRLEKQKRIVEWGEIRNRWKRRKYDFRNEPDVGNAISTSVAILASQEALCSTELEPSTALSQIEEDVDTTDDEHDTILQRLSQPSQISLLSQQQNDNPEDDVPWSQRLDFWQLGYQAPRVNHSYWKTPLNLDHQHKGTDKVRILSSGTKEDLFTLGHFPPSQLRPPKYSLQYLRFPSRNQDAFGSFIHARNATVVASRVLSAGPSGSGTDLSNRFVRLLWDKEVLSTALSTQVEIMTRFQGQSLRFFYRYKWRNPSEVAQLLGLTPTLQLMGPQSMVDEPLTLNSMKLRYLTLHDRILHDFIEKDTTVIPWDFANSEIQSTPGVHFVPVPGAVPPTPSFPLDALGIVLGPMDKYHYAERVESAVDDGTYQLTLSSLLSRLSDAHLNERHADEPELKRHIMDLANSILQANQNKLYKRLAKTKRRVSELPLSSFAKASEWYCSLVANHFLDGEDATAQGDAEEASFSSSHGTLLELSSHNGLQLFSSLHITLGLMELARALPPCARNMLDQPFNDLTCRSPLEVVRQLLEYLEESHLLVEASSSLYTSEDSVMVEELEYAFHRAVETFEKCVTRDPTEIDHHSWLLAALAGSLLLSSGNRIEPQAAQTHPSYLVQQHVLLNSFQSKSRLTGNHEVRRRLPKFPSLRVETIQAFQRMNNLGRHQEDAARVHLAIATFLEWKQVIALLLGPKPVQNSFHRIRLRHRIHATQWAVCQGQSTTGGYLHSLHLTNCSLEDRVSYLAALLESDPSSRENWLAFVRELGPFGSPTVESRQSRCVCVECQRLFSPCIIMNHDKFRRLRDWWRGSRFLWWEQGLLHLPLHRIDKSLDSACLDRRRDSCCARA